MTVIAIDGPSASGKSTVARGVAAALGCLYVDSGSVYRGITWQALREGLDVADGAAVAALTERIPLEFYQEATGVRFRIGDVTPVQELRTKAIDESVSRVAANQAVRTKVVAWLRSLTQFGDLVMEGRDIGTAVFPGTPHKFYLDASAEERARRRHAEIVGQQKNVEVKDVGDALRRRDQIDSTRKVDPLKVAPDATIVDSTGLSAEQVVARVVEQVRRGGLAGPAAG